MMANYFDFICDFYISVRWAVKWNQELPIRVLLFSESTKENERLIREYEIKIQTNIQFTYFTALWAASWIEKFFRAEISHRKWLNIHTVFICVIMRPISCPKASIYSICIIIFQLNFFFSLQTAVFFLFGFCIYSYDLYFSFSLEALFHT